jgi:hypothetical protein
MIAERIAQKVLGRDSLSDDVSRNQKFPALLLWRAT